MIRVLLVDDHALIRRGLRDLLSQQGDMVIAGEAGSLDELREVMRRIAFDVLLLDINLPGASGLQVLDVLKAQVPGARALMVSMYPEDQYAVQALRAGAWGYVNKSAESAVLVGAIRKVAAGHKYISPEIASALVDRLTAQPAGLPHERLSDREQMMLRMIAAGRKLPDIATQLSLTPKSVSIYRARLLEKMKFSTHEQLAHYAREHGLV